MKDLRRQILEDVLGDSVEEYENFERNCCVDNKKQHRQRVPLWQFLLHLLHRDTSAHFIDWNDDQKLEFCIKDTNGVAELWGSVKNKTDMTYEKLGRAMRYYYGKNIIEKVSGKRYSYRFIYSRRTKKYLAKFINVTDLQIETESRDTKQRITAAVVSKDKPFTIMKPAQLFKPKPLKQNKTKTKIFRPKDAFQLKTFEDSALNQRLLQTSRPSAFIVPKKHANRARIINSIFERSNDDITVRRSITTWGEFESYSPRYYSKDVRFFPVYQDCKSNMDEEFSLQSNDARDDRDIVCLQEQLNRSSDPFMGIFVEEQIDHEHFDGEVIFV